MPWSWAQRTARDSSILLLTDGEDKTTFLPTASADDTMYNRFGKFEQRYIPNTRYSTGFPWVQTILILIR